MTKAFWFWIILVIFVLLGGVRNRAALKAGDFSTFGNEIVLIVLLALLGYQVFGEPIH